MLRNIKKDRIFRGKCEMIFSSGLLVSTENRVDLFLEKEERERVSIFKNFKEQGVNEV